MRRRAALAIGRVGLPEAVPALVPLLADGDPEVRQMAAYALGLIGDRSAREPLLAALGDAAPSVKGSAAEALGMLGDAAAAPAIARMVADLGASGAVAVTPSDDLDAARDTPQAAFRLGIYALVKLKAYDAFAGAVLDPSGVPRVRWWPVAYAFQRFEDPRALQALLTLLKETHPYTRAFAAKGLGAINERAAADALLPLVAAPERAVAIEAIRSLARLREKRAAQPLLAIAQSAKAESHVRLEAVTALGAVSADGVYDTLLDLLGDRIPAIRAAAIRSLSRLDPEGFVTVLSGLDPDTNWSVRAALASGLGDLTAEAGMPRLRSMLDDPEPKVIPAVIAAIARLHPPDAGPLLLEQLKAADPAVRAAAARAVGELKLPEGAAALNAAYQRSLGDSTYVARAAALTGLRQYGADVARPVLADALADKDWAVRLHAANLLAELDSATDARVRIRPVPSARAADWYGLTAVATPPVSTHVYLDMDRGSIQLELAVLDAPLTVQNFVTLARQGFFDGLPFHRVVPNFVVQGGDPRGDGEGGPGYTIRDEINQRPYLRGTVGMALDWADTGGSQFFITHSPQPHLDGRYTVFGRVLAGMDIVDGIEQWDVIRRVRVWDGSPTN